MSHFCLKSFAKAMKKALPTSWVVAQELARRFEGLSTLVLVADPMAQKEGTRRTLVGGKVALKQAEAQIREQKWMRAHPC